LVVLVKFKTDEEVRKLSPQSPNRRTLVNFTHAM